MTFARCKAMVKRFTVVPHIVALSVFIPLTSQAQSVAQLTQQEMHYQNTNAGLPHYTDQPAAASSDQRPSLAGIKYIPLKETMDYTLYDKLEPSRETRELWIREADGSIAVFEDDTGDQW